MTRRLLLVLMLGLNGLALGAGPATADGCVGAAAADDDVFNVDLVCGGDGSSSGVGPSPIASSDGEPATTYAYQPACLAGEGITNDGFYGCGSQQTCGQNGLLYNEYMIQGPTSTPLGFVCVEEGQEASTGVLTPGRILEAFRRVEVPTAPIGVNPVGGRTLVNFDTIFHTEAEPFMATVQLLGRSVTFDITPSEFTWKTGEGEFTTSEPGREYRASLPMSAYVTHQYLRAGKVDLGLNTTWTARWRVGNGPWQPVDGTVTTSSPSVPLEVVTARPQLISYD